jgi:hypothetical protein
MSMTHCVGRGVIGPWPFIEITGDRFRELKEAQQNISILLGIEEKFEMVIDNYLEYERDLLGLALAHMASHEVTWESFRDAGALINRRLANALTASRLYIDQAKHDLSRAYEGNTPLIAEITDAFSQQYDRLQGYRVMEELRNFLQHRALPLTDLVYGRTWEDRPNGKLLHYSASAQLRIETLQGDKKIKRRVIEEFERAKSETQDLTLLLRQYIEGLSCAHGDVRRVTNGSIEPWKNTLLEMIRQYSEACGEEVRIVVAFEMVGDDVADEIHLFRDGIDRLEEFRARRLPTHLSRCYVSNEGGLQSTF